MFDSVYRVFASFCCSPVITHKLECKVYYFLAKEHKLLIINKNVNRPTSYVEIFPLVRHNNFSDVFIVASRLINHKEI
jgi:hypothetical protein